MSDFKDGLTRVRYNGRVGTVIMCHTNGDLNICFDPYEVETNIPSSKVSIVEQINSAPAVELQTAEVKRSFWSRLKFWKS